MAYVSAKLYEDSDNGLVCIMFKSLLYANCDIDIWPLTSKLNRVHTPTMANTPDKFDE